MFSDFELNQLTEAERDQILKVLRRDDELRRKEQERIRELNKKLRNEVKQLRLKGVIREGQDANKTCARCREAFGWFFNTGAICPNCQHRVCEKCRHYKDKNTWICILCFKQMELEAMTNHWFYSKFRKSKRSKKTNRVISGSEIVRASFRRPAHMSEDGTVLAGNSLTEEVKRALYNNNPNSATKSATDGENSDTQSTEGLPPTRRLERVAFPEEEDQQLLMELMRGRQQNSDPSTLGQHHVEVKRVTSNRYRDSDSESDSCPSSPRLSSRNESMFAHTDSPRSSLRSSGVSSDGRITIVTDVGGLSDMEVASVDTMAYGSTSGWEPEQERRARDHQGVSGSCDPEGSRSRDARSTGIRDEGYGSGMPRDHRNGAPGQNAVRNSGHREDAQRDGPARSGSCRDGGPGDDGHGESPNRLRPRRDGPRGDSPQRGSPRPAQRFSAGPAPTGRKPAAAALAKDFSRRNPSTSSTDSDSAPYSRHRATCGAGRRTPSPDDRLAPRENGPTTRSGDLQPSDESSIFSEDHPEQASLDFAESQSQPSWDQKDLAVGSVPAAMSSSSSSSDPDDTEASLETDTCKSPISGDGLNPETIPSPDPIRHKVSALLARFGKGALMSSDGGGGGLSAGSGTRCSVVEEQHTGVQSSLSASSCDQDEHKDLLKPSLPVYLASLNEPSSEKDHHVDDLPENKIRHQLTGMQGKEQPASGSGANLHEMSWQRIRHDEEDFWAKDDIEHDDRGTSSSSDQMEWDSDMSAGGHTGQHHDLHHDVKHEYETDEERERAIQVLKNNLLAAGFPDELSRTATNSVDSDPHMQPGVLEKWFQGTGVYSSEQLVYIRDALERAKKSQHYPLVPASEDDVDSLSVISEKTEPVDTDDDNVTVRDESSSDVDSVDLDVVMNLGIPDLSGKITVTKVIEAEPVPIHSNASHSAQEEAAMPYRPYHTNSNLPKALLEQDTSQTSERSETESAKDEVPAPRMAGAHDANDNDNEWKQPDLNRAAIETTSTDAAKRDRSAEVSSETGNSDNRLQIENEDDSFDNSDLDDLVESQNLSIRSQNQSRLDSSGRYSYNGDDEGEDDDDNNDEDDDGDLDCLLESNKHFISDAEMEEIITSMSYDRGMAALAEEAATASDVDKGLRQQVKPKTLTTPRITVDDVDGGAAHGEVRMREKPGRSELVDRSPIASVSDLKELFSKEAGSRSPSAHGTSTPKQEELWWKNLSGQEKNTSLCEEPVPQEAGISPVVSVLKEFDVPCDTKTYVIPNEDGWQAPECGTAGSVRSHDRTAERPKPAVTGQQRQRDADCRHEETAVAEQTQRLRPCIVGPETARGQPAALGQLTEHLEPATGEAVAGSLTSDVAGAPTAGKRSAPLLLDDETDSKVRRVQSRPNGENPQLSEDLSERQPAPSPEAMPRQEDVVSSSPECLQRADEGQRSCFEQLSDNEQLKLGRSSSFEDLYSNVQFEESRADDDTDKASVANGHLAPPNNQRAHQRLTRDGKDRLATPVAVDQSKKSTSSGNQDSTGDDSQGDRSPVEFLPAAGVTASPLSNRSAVSGEGEDVEEEENIDELFQSHASVQSFTDSKRSSNLLSPFTTSRESIASYYSDAGEGSYGKIPVTGEVLFALDYNYKNNVFEVHVKQCRDLAPVDTKKKRSDPYVKTYLLPDKTKSGKRKTRVKKHTLNPSFDETLRYQITKSELENRTLWLTVWHNDTFGRNDFLGEVNIPMDEYTFTKTAPRWYPLQDRFIPQTDEQASSMSKLAYKGDLIVSLKFVTCDYLMNKRRGRAGERGELQVLIKEARNLTAVRANGTSDPFCKGYLLPEKTKHAKQKTPVKKKDCNPVWNHTFVFEDIAWADLKERSLELTVWDHDRFTSNDFLGGVRLGLGTGTSGGRPVDWMDSQGEEVTIWKSMLERPNVWIDGTLILRPSMEGRK